MVVKFRVRQKVAAWLVDEVEVYADSEEEAMGMLKENINRNTGRDRSQYDGYGDNGILYGLG